MTSRWAPRARRCPACIKKIGTDAMDESTSRHGGRRRLRWRRLAALSAGAGMAVASLSAPVAPQALAAGHPTHGDIVSANPSALTPDVLDGHVDAFAQVGRLMVVGGVFDHIRSHDGQTYKRRNVFAFDVGTGDVSTSFRPRVNGEVNALLASRDRTGVYLAGAFTTVNGRKHTGRIARVRVSNGSVDRRFASPGVNDTIRDLEFARGRYYISGYFTKVGGRQREFIAALDSTGRDTGTVTLRFSGTNRRGRSHIRSMDIAPGGSSIVIAGNFMRINGHRRAQIATLTVGKRRTTLSSWSTTRLKPQCGTHFDSYPRDVAFAPNGRYFVLVTTGGPRGTQASGLLCDTATRWNVARGPGQQPAWIDYTGGDTLTAVIVDKNVVYVGGHQRYLNNSFGHNEAGRGAVSRPGIAALDPFNGLPYEWNPGRNRGVGVFGLALTMGGLWVGHDTAEFGGGARLRVGVWPGADGAGAAPHPT